MRRDFRKIVDRAGLAGRQWAPRELRQSFVPLLDAQVPLEVISRLAAAVAVRFKLDENLPVSSAAILTSAGHDVDTVIEEGLIGAPGRDVVAAATAAGRILISPDRGLGDIRAYPPGGHAGIVVLRLPRPVRRCSH